MIGCCVVLAVILLLVGWNGVGGTGPDTRRAITSATSWAARDPIDAYAAARPDWYFVGLYQFAHYFPGTLKIVPIFIVPGAAGALVLAHAVLGRHEDRTCRERRC